MVWCSSGGVARRSTHLLAYMLKIRFEIGEVLLKRGSCAVPISNNFQSDFEHRTFCGCWTFFWALIAAAVVKHGAHRWNVAQLCCERHTGQLAHRVLLRIRTENIAKIPRPIVKAFRCRIFEYSRAAGIPMPLQIKCCFFNLIGVNHFN